MKRREFLQFALAGAGAAALSPAMLGAALQRLPPGALAPLPSGDGRDPVIHAIRRLTYGVTPELVAHVSTIGVGAFIDEQLNPELIPDPGVSPLLEPLMPILSENGGVLQRQLENRRGQVAGALIAAATVRAVASKRQLYERMVAFWSDHFNVYIGKGPVLFLKIDDDRDVIRPKALGRFRELLGATAHSPAMLIYLDNALSEKSHPNENYSRELLELHTLGVNGGYTEDDVKEVARAFTGWSVSGRRENSDGRIEFRFRRLFHDNGEKTVLGMVIPADGGQRDGETVLDLLAAHPSTAAFVARKLVRRFVADQPPAELVEAVASVFSGSGGDIRAALRVIFMSDTFRDAPPKFKQPFEYTVSLLRALNYRIERPVPLIGALRDPLDALGNLPFSFPAPSGYPDVMGAWMNGLLMRWNLAVSAAGGTVEGAAADAEALLSMWSAAGIPFETDAVIEYMAGYLFGRALRSDERAIILDFARAASAEIAEQIRSALALMLASPAFQYR